MQTYSIFQLIKKIITKYTYTHILCNKHFVKCHRHVNAKFFFNQEFVYVCTMLHNTEIVTCNELIFKALLFFLLLVPSFNPSLRYMTLSYKQKKFRYPFTELRDIKFNHKT